MERAVRPATVLNRLVGLFPYNENYNFSFCLVNTATVVALFTVNVYAILENGNGRDFNAFTQTMFVSVCIVNYLLVVLLAFKAITSKRGIRKIFNGITDLESRLAELGIFVDGHVKLTYLDIGFRIVFMGLLCAMNYRYYMYDIVRPSFKEMFIRFIGIYSTQFLINCHEILFGCLAFHVGGIYSSLTDNLDFHSAPSLVVVHKTLTSIASDLDGVYAATNFAVVSATFLTCTVDVYLVASSFGNTSGVVIILLILGRTALRAYEIWSTVTATSYLSYQAKNFDVQLFAVMLDDATKTLVTNVKLKVHLTMKQNVTFSGWGFFNLNYPLLHSIIAASTSYLVILIQFGGDSNKL